MLKDYIQREKQDHISELLSLDKPLSFLLISESS